MTGELPEDVKATLSILDNPQALPPVKLKPTRTMDDIALPVPPQSPQDDVAQTLSILDGNQPPEIDASAPNPRDIEADVLKMALRKGVKSNTALAAHRKSVAQKLNIAPDLVTPQAEETAFYKDHNPEDLQKNYPALAKYLGVQGNAELVGKNLDPLKEVETFYRRSENDPAIALAKGVIGVGQVVVGLGNLVSGGKAGKYVEEKGLDLRKIQSVLNDLYSAESQKVMKDVGDAKGFWNTVGTALQSPSSIGLMTVESLPQMYLGGRVIGGALQTAFPALSFGAAGAIGEGVTMAGGSAEQIRSLTDNGELTGEQTALALGVGVLGTGLSVLGNKLATKFGFEDPDADIVAGKLLNKLQESGVPKPLAVRIIGGAAIEGGVEEMPQSIVEQIAQNVALDRPWSEGVENAAALGLVTGGAMGAAFQVGAQPGRQSAAAQETPAEKQARTVVQNTIMKTAAAVKAEDQRNAIQDWGKRIKTNDTLRKESPESFKEFIRTMSDEDGAVKEVFVDAKLLNETLAQTGIDRDQLAKDMPEVAEGLADALATNGEVRIPIEDYAAHIVGTPIENAILDHLRTTPDGMTYAESQVFFQQQQEDFVKQAEKLINSNEPVLTRKEFAAQAPEGMQYKDYLQAHKNKVEAFATDLREVRNTLVEGLNSTGRFTKSVSKAYAIPFSQFFAENAARMGVLPTELYESLPLNFAKMQTADILAPNAGTLSQLNTGVLTQSTFYSALERNISGLNKLANKQGIVKTDQVEKWIASRIKDGAFKKDEVEAIGLSDFLKLKGAEVPVAEVENFVKQNGLQINETMISQDEGQEPDPDLVFDRAYNTFLEDHKDDFVDEDGNIDEQAQQDAWDFESDRYLTDAREAIAQYSGPATVFEQYTLKGGEDYRELALTLPGETKFNVPGAHSFNIDEADANRLAHVRFDTRYYSEQGTNKKVLFIEEIQSDWAQQGRDKGFKRELTASEAAEAKQLTERTTYLRDKLNDMQLSGKSDTAEYETLRNERKALAQRLGALNALRSNEGVQPAPFITDTKSWVSLVLKRMMRYAAENGFDSIAWTTGAQQSVRYSLARSIDSVSVIPHDTGKRAINLVTTGGNPPFKLMVDQQGIVSSPFSSGNQFAGNKLSEVVGVELADKIMSAKEETTFSGLDLEVGGEGMKAFYDKGGIVDQVASKLAKQFGGKATRAIDMSAPNKNILSWEVYHEQNPKVTREDYDRFVADYLKEKINENIGAQPGFDITPELKAKIMQGLPLFQGNRAGFNPSTFTISLLQGADLSSVIHEGAHFYLEALADLAGRENAPQQIKDDFRTTLEWFGITGNEQGTPGGSDLEQKAFHGSPHSFDKFSTANIGTGEGAQAYGYGLYFTDTKSIAEFYRKALQSNDLVNADGTPLPGAAAGTEEKFAQTLLKANSGDYAKSIKEAKADENTTEGDKRFSRLVENVLKDYKKRGVTTKAKSGAIYEVELKPSEDEYLLWDKPLSEQSDKVKSALEDFVSRASDRKSARSLKAIAASDPKGETLYLALKNEYPDVDNKNKAASDYLHSIGIRGIKYLDGTSRGTGEGSYNYVIFSDNDVEIQAFYQSAKLPETVNVDGVERPTMNSEGRPIYPTEEGIRNFWKWFGKSVARERMTSSRQDFNKMRPTIMYHTTRNSFDTFETGRVSKNSGTFGEWDVNRHAVFITDSIEDAEAYGTAGGGFVSGANTMGVYIRAENPLDMTGGYPDNVVAEEFDKAGFNSRWLNRFDWSKFDDEEGKHFIETAKSLGYDSVIFDDENPDTGNTFEAWAIFDPTQIKSAIGNNGDFSGRASILEQGGENQQQPTTPLPPGATPEEIWSRMTLDQKRPYHEQWAQSYERYTLEGKAPTVEMQPVFARFREWMLSVYNSMKDFLAQNPLAGKLNDDIRSVFDRLIASEEKIYQAEEARGYASLFGSAAEAGLSEPEYEKYQELGKLASSRAVDNLTSRSIRDMRWLSNAKDKTIKKLQAEANAKRAAVTEQVTDEVDAMPLNRARNFLTTGEFIDEAGVRRESDTKFKLNEAEVKALVNGEVPADIKGMVSPDGVGLELAANLLGFQSPETLVDQLVNGESRDVTIQGMTDQRMLEQYGDLTDDKAIERAAEKAIHNEARARFMATGLKLLTKTELSAAQLNRAAKMAAESTIAKKKIRSITPGQFTRAEAKANREALDNVARDPKKAIDAQRAALLNNRLAKAALDAADDVEAILKYFKKFDSKGVRKAVGIDQMDQIDDLLQEVDRDKSLPLKEIDKRQALADWVAEQEADNFEPVIDPVQAEQIKAKHYKDMTVDELRMLRDTVKQIEHIGRLKQTLLTEMDRADFRERVDEAERSIRDNANRTVEEKGTPTDVIGETNRWVRQMVASHRKFSSFIREMDGGRDGGVMWRLLSKNMNAAGDNEVEMRRASSEAVSDLFKLFEQEKAPLNLYAKRMRIPGTNIAMTQEQRIMFGMNWGNEGNRQRALDGGIVGKRALSITEAQAILDTLTKQEWDFIQGTWDHIATYKDQIAALERKLTGIEPAWVEPSEVKTKYGTYRGGYFPAKYDTELSTRSESLEAVTDTRMGMKGAFNAAATRKGFTEKRSEAVVNRPLLLSYNVIANHISEVTHRLAWQPWLIDANRVLKALDAPIRQHYGAEVLREMRNTVTDIAAGDVGSRTPMEKAINHLRAGSTIVGMGWRFSTAFLQPSGLAQSWARIGGKWVAKGVAEVMKNPNAASEQANLESSVMRNRDITVNREVNDVLNRVRTTDSLNILTASYFWLIAKMQRIVDLPTYYGAKEKAFHDLKLENAATAEDRARIMSDAIALAEQAVIDSQSGGQLKDLASIQRGHPGLKLFTNFYSYFSATYNLNIEALRRTNFRSPTDLAFLAGDLILLNVLPVLFSLALKEVTKGKCGDDTDCLIKAYGYEQAGYMFGQMILLRDMGSAALVAAGGDQYGYSGPAGLRFFSDLYKAGVQVNQGELDWPLFKSVSNTAGVLLHFPTGQINTTLEGIMAVESGDVDGVSVLPALLFGPPKD